MKLTSDEQDMNPCLVPWGGYPLGTVVFWEHLTAQEVEAGRLEAVEGCSLVRGKLANGSDVQQLWLHVGERGGDVGQVRPGGPKRVARSLLAATEESGLGPRPRQGAQDDVALGEVRAARPGIAALEKFFLGR